MRELCLAALLACATTGAVHAAQPNIVVVMADDDGIAGFKHQTKIHELLVDKGITFTNIYSASPSCSPDRAAFLTGLYPHNSGILENRGSSEIFEKSWEQNSLPKWLKQAGYKTALFGKYFNQYKSARVPAYWDRWFAFNKSTYYDARINSDGTIKQYGKAPSEYSTDLLGNEAVAWIKEHVSDGPLFVMYAPKAPHGDGREHPYPVVAPNYREVEVAKYVPPETWASGKYDLEEANTLWDARLRAMLSVEDRVADIVQAFADAGELENTIFLYLTDHGFCVGEHGWFSKGLPLECSIKPYAVIRGPGIPEGETRDQLVSFVDFAATLCDLAGCTPGIDQDGRSLMPIIDDADAPWRSALLVEWHPVNYKAVRSGDWKLVAYATGAKELYDLGTDPNETTNLAGNEKNEAEQSALQTTLDGLKDCSGSSCWVE